MCYEVNELVCLAAQPEAPRNPCNPTPCGANAVCRERNGAGSCSCQPGYSGDPYAGCRPECVLNSDCPRNRVCANNKCADPCPGMCGQNAECRVVNHAPSCACLPGLTGNPASACTQPPPTSKLTACLLTTAIVTLTYKTYLLQPSLFEKCLILNT